MDGAQREAALARVRAILEESDSTPSEQRSRDFRALLDGLKTPFEPEHAETVARTVVNIGVALAQGIVPVLLHDDVVAALFDWMENEKGIHPDWRSQIVLRLGSVVYSNCKNTVGIDPELCDLIAKRVLIYACGRRTPDEPAEQGVDLIFVAGWESQALGDQYVVLLADTLYTILQTVEFHIAMLGRVLHSMAILLTQRRIPGDLHDPIVFAIADAMPALREADSPHYYILAWALSDFSARERAENIPLAFIEQFAIDEKIDEQTRESISNNIAIARVMQSMRETLASNEIQEPEPGPPTAEDIDERLIRGLMIKNDPR